MMLLPFLLFWILIFLGRDELGLKGGVVTVVIWLALLLACALTGLSSYIFVAIQALIDIILLITIFGGDIRIR